MCNENMYRQAYLEIDLGVALKNMQVLTEKAFSSADVCAVVKANAYGHGDKELADVAIKGGAKCVAVAFLEEGISLRQKGFSDSILMLFEPAAEAIEELVGANITPIVYTKKAIEACSSAALKFKKKSLPIHLKVNTGMNRLGCDVAKVGDIATFALSKGNLQISGISTHFANADREDDDLSEVQYEDFLKAISILDNEINNSYITHCANSPAYLKYQNMHMNMARIGALFYGLAPYKNFELEESIKPVATYKAKVIEVRNLKASEGAFYGHLHKKDCDNKVALIPVGYADGIPVTFSSVNRNGEVGKVLIRGECRRVVGSVAMDFILVECGDDVSKGDEVVLLGSQGKNHITAEDWCNLVGGNTRSVLTAIGSSRLRRVYI